MLQADEVQLEAIQHGAGPMLVTAGPGSGKTTVITYRIYHLIHSLGISPEQILVITFTKAAAGQMRNRFLSLSKEEGNGVTFSTFHAFFYHLIQEENAFETLSVLKESEKKKIMAEAVRRAGISYPQNEMIEELLRQISYMRNHFVDCSAYVPVYFQKDFFERVYLDYTEQLKILGKIDFDDMMLECRRLLYGCADVLQRWQKKFTYFMIDEFQDINPLQYDILMLLASKTKNIFCVGDEDQAIYGFRGASPKLMFSFLDAFPDAKHLLMTRNYRSDAQIVSAANRIIQKNKERFNKKVIANSEKKDGLLKLSCFEDKNVQYREIAKQIKHYLKDNKPEEIVVLFRTNSISQEFLDAMYEEKIPVRMHTNFQTLADEEITKDIYAYLQLAGGMLTYHNFLRVMNKPVRYLSKDLLQCKVLSFEALEKKASSKIYCLEQINLLKKQLQFIAGLPPYAAVHYIRKGIGYERYLLEKEPEKHMKITKILDDIQISIKKFHTAKDWMEHLLFLKEEAAKAQDNTESAISLLTMHASKGLEYNCVIIPDVTEGNFPFHRAKTISELEEERRVFYVGMTRAKSHLMLCSVKNSVAEMKPSVYFEELML